jgi:hypothetical protein
MTGRNSGIKSIGESTHTAAIARAIFADRGTRGSLCRRRTAVTHAGMNAATSFRRPAGKRAARTTSSAHDPSNNAAPIIRVFSIHDECCSGRQPASTGEDQSPRPATAVRPGAMACGRAAERLPAHRGAGGVAVHTRKEASGCSPRSREGPPRRESEGRGLRRRRRGRGWLGKYPACEREPDKKRNHHENREYPERDAFHYFPSEVSPRSCQLSRPRSLPQELVDARASGLRHREAQFRACTDVRIQGSGRPSGHRRSQHETRQRRRPWRRGSSPQHLRPGQ